MTHPFIGSVLGIALALTTCPYLAAQGNTKKTTPRTDLTKAVERYEALISELLKEMEGDRGSVTIQDRRTQEAQGLEQALLRKHFEEESQRLGEKLQLEQEKSKALQQQVDEAKIARTTLEEGIETTRREQQQARAELDRARTALSSTERRAADFRARLDQSAEENAAVRKQYDSLKVTAAEAQSLVQVQSTQSEEQRRTLRRALQTSQSDLTTAERELATITRAADELRLGLADAERGKTELQAEVNSLGGHASEASMFRKRTDVLEAERRQLTQSIGEFQAALRASRQGQDRNRTLVAEVQIALEAARGRVREQAVLDDQRQAENHALIEQVEALKTALETAQNDARDAAEQQEQHRAMSARARDLETALERAQEQHAAARSQQEALQRAFAQRTQEYETAVARVQEQFTEAQQVKERATAEQMQEYQAALERAQEQVQDARRAIREQNQAGDQRVQALEGELSKSVGQIQRMEAALAESRDASQRAEALQDALVQARQAAATMGDAHSLNEALREQLAVLETDLEEARSDSRTALAADSDARGQLITDLQRKLRAAEARFAELAQRQDAVPVPAVSPPAAQGTSGGGGDILINNQGGTIIINNGTGGSIGGTRQSAPGGPTAPPPAGAKPRKRIG